ncbi:MAG: ABC-2 transporter permease [Oscillospiraceae bacterium]|nr:ABC-2 transporter permease [Oscillospiraceae bacterium]
MMSKYKSLLFRELLISRKHNIIVLVLVLLYVALIFLAINMTGEQDDSQSVIMMQCIILATITSVVAAEDNEVVKSDIKTKWRSYSYALPITALEKTVSRFIIRVGMISIGAVICFVCTAVVDKLCSVSVLGSVITIYFISVALMMLYDALYSGFILRARNEKQYKRYAAIGTVIIFVVAKFISNSEFNFDVDDNNLPDILNYIIHISESLSLWAVPAIIAALAVNFVVTIKSYERREN